MHPIYVGCAGWAIPTGCAGKFPGHGSRLERYSGLFGAVEINSSFYRPHRAATYTRWASAVPADFRFAVKVFRQITHESRLRDLVALRQFLSEVSGLGRKLGVLLLQLPPSLSFEAAPVREFFTALRGIFDGPVACEPRHATWFTPEAERILNQFRVARVAADPPPAPGAENPGGWIGLRYFRLHGAPQIYHSSYSPEFVQSLAGRLTDAALSAPVWCIFNNTAQGAAVENAHDLMAHLKRNCTPERPRD